MFPGEELDDLARRKALLQARIALGRFDCVTAAEALGRPIALVDRGVAVWRRISPVVKLLAIPAGLFLGSRFGGSRHPRRRRGGRLGTVLSLAPLILRGVKLFTTARAAVAAARTAPPAGR